MQCCLLKDCFGHDLVIFVPKVQNIDVAMVIEWGTDSARGNRRGSIWRQVGTCNDDLEAQTDEKPPLALQLVQSLDFVTCDKGHATEIAHQERNKMAQLAAMRWAKASEMARKSQEKIAKMACQRHRYTGKSDVGVQTDVILGSTSLDPSTVSIKSPRFGETDTQITIGGTLLAHCWANLWRQVPQYSSEVYDVPLLLYLSSAKTYRILRQILCLPAVSTIHKKYRQTFKVIRKQLLELSYIHVGVSDVLAEIKKLRDDGLLVNPKFTLAIDAFCFRTFCGTPLGSPHSHVPRTNGNDGDHDGVVTVEPDQVQFNHGFIFLLVPHDYRIPVRILRVKASTSGSYSKEIDNIAEHICGVCNELKLRVWFRATDGDPGMNTHHDNFYNRFGVGDSACLLTLVTRIHAQLTVSTDMWIPITDPLHAMKNMRSRLIKHSIQIFKWK